MSDLNFPPRCISLPPKTTGAKTFFWIMPTADILEPLAKKIRQRRGAEGKAVSAQASRIGLTREAGRRALGLQTPDLLTPLRYYAVLRCNRQITGFFEID